jgi:hypothetical protein
MQKAGRTIGKWLRRVVTSDGWKLFQQTSREIQTLPNRLMREAALDELNEVQKDLRQPLDMSGPTTEPASGPSTQARPRGEQSTEARQDNRILPPTAPAGDHEEKDA